MNLLWKIIQYTVRDNNLIPLALNAAFLLNGEDLVLFTVNTAYIIIGKIKCCLH